MLRRRRDPMTSPTSMTATALMGLLFLLTSACGSSTEPGVPPLREPLGPVDVAERAPDEALAREVVALNADHSVAVIVHLEIDDLQALPVGEDVDVSPGGAVRAFVMASGTIPERHPACALVENPLPDEVNPCVDAVTLREVEQPVPLTGVLVLSANDDFVAGEISAFWGDDDAIRGTF